MKIVQRKQFMKVNKEIKEVEKTDFNKLKNKTNRIIQRVEGFFNPNINQGRHEKHKSTKKFFSKQEISEHFKEEGLKKKLLTKEI